jgi:hypothetical protein
MTSRAPFTILERLADSDRPYLASPRELRELANELELHGGYQIQAWKREGDDSERVEIFVTFPKKRE